VPAEILGSCPALLQVQDPRLWSERRNLCRQRGINKLVGHPEAVKIASCRYDSVVAGRTGFEPVSSPPYQGAALIL
jgi:hypothetical protein